MKLVKVKSEPNIRSHVKKNNLPPLTKNFFVANKKNENEEQDVKREDLNIINLTKVNQIKLLAMP